jgi:hypothetical protein
VARVSSNELVPVTELPKPLKECSGMVRIGQDQLVANNDSGNKPVLYVFSEKENEVTRKIFVANAENRDWEELASDDDYVYIGDTGNNGGKRTDLRIFRIRKKDILDLDTVIAEKITFSYKDQTKFTDSNLHNFDCEAMISKGDSLFLFTKNRGDFRTNVYGMPKTPGDYVLEKTVSYDTRGLVTGADYRETLDGGELVLVGYSVHGKALYPFVVYFPDVESSGFFSGKAIRKDYRQVLQTETIIFHGNKKAYVTNEEEDEQDGFIYEVDLSGN